MSSTDAAAAEALITEVWAAGATVDVGPDGKVRVRPLDALSADLRGRLLEQKVLVAARVRELAEGWGAVQELMRFPPGPAPAWDGPAAVALMSAADDHVERSGIPGSHPEVQAAVVAMADAYGRHDLAGVRAGADEVKAAANRLAAGTSA